MGSYHISKSNEALQTAPDINSARLKLQMAKAENHLTDTEQRLGINLVKFSYNDRKDDDMEFQVGINIPLGIKFDNAKGQQDLYSAKSQLNEGINTLTQSLAIIQNEINWLEQEKQIVQSQVKRINFHLDKQYATTNPFLMLSLRKELLAHHKKDAEIRYKLLTLYVNYLAQSGQLTLPPLRNWIQKGTPAITLSKSH